MGIVYHLTSETTLRLQCNNVVLIEMAAIYEVRTIKITTKITING